MKRLDGRKPALAAVAAAMLSLAPSYSMDADEIDRFVAREMERQRIPGLALAAVVVDAERRIPGIAVEPE